MAEGAFRIGSVVGRSMSVLGKNIVPFGLLYLAINAPSALYALTHPVAVSRDTTSNMLALAQTIVGMAATAAITYGTINELRGRRRSLGEFLRSGLAQGGAAIRVAFLSGFGILLGFIALVLPGLFLYTIWWVAIPVAVIERPGAFASLTRSANLTKGFRWRIFGLIAAFMILAFGLAMLSGIIVGGALGVLGGSEETFTRYVAIIEWLWTTLIMAAQATLSAVGYYDLRVAKEGVEIGDIAAVFD
jgi:hypothetical protein